MNDHYLVGVMDNEIGEYTEWDGYLFANNGSYVVLDTNIGRVWIAKGPDVEITFTQIEDD